MYMEMDFEYNLPVNLKFGEGKVQILGEETAKYGHCALIVTGKKSSKKTGLLDLALQKLHEAGVTTCLFDQVAPNPLSTTVEEGVRRAKKGHCDVIVALGGGSVMDCAKAIAFSFYNEGNLFDYIEGIKEGDKALPIIAVPTTCGTGSEANSLAVLTHPKTRDKKYLKKKACLPKVSIIDPQLMLTMPSKLAGSVMFDAFSHNLEAYISKSAHPLVAVQSLYALELLAQNMVKAYKDHTEREAWCKVTLASTIGGMSIELAGITAVHGMAHPVSGCHNIMHGRGLAALSPGIYKKTIEHAPKKFEKISVLLGGAGAYDFVERLEDLLDELELSTSLSQEGITHSDIEWMAEKCLKASPADMHAHPKAFTKKEIEELYLGAF